MTEIEWNAGREQWELNGRRFQGEILWCNGWHEGLNIHDAWWCLWRTVQEHRPRCPICGKRVTHDSNGRVKHQTEDGYDAD